MSQSLSRREFIGSSVVVAAGLAAGAPARGNSVSVIVRAPDGKPLDATRLKTFIARDLANDPLPLEFSPADGRCEIPVGGEPFQLACRLEVPGFGEVYCYADNGGHGYSRPATVDFVADAARTRYRRVHEAARQEKAACAGDEVFARHLKAAGGRVRDTASAYEALAHGLHAGERLTLDAARRRIARLPGPRRDLLFGAMYGRNHGPDYERRFAEAFNFATISWYIWNKNAEPEAERIDYGRMDATTQWCADHGVAAKGFGYVYLTRGAMPEWLRDWPYEKLLAEYERVVAQTTRRFAGRWRCVEVINEAHDVSNLMRYSHAQLLELTRAACRAARQGAPKLDRLINNCCLWSEHAKRRNADGSRRWSAYRYLADCIANGVEFERIGLQLYYPEQDLFEIERMLDRFKVFGRRLHISEVGCNSEPGLDPTCARPKDDVPGWHGPWTEAMQADWAEALFTICYSKPEFEAVGWWDLADYDGHFWPHGGLLHKDGSPKESYARLLALKKSWGLV
jgi:GH35 family endo-1,4-beta-xylanase